MSEGAAIPSSASIGLVDEGKRGAASRKAVILGATVLGDMASATVLLLYTFGIFISTFHQAFGWSRADAALSMTWFTIVVFLGSPVVGRFADRWDPGRLAAASMFTVGVVLLLVPHIIHSIATLWIAYAALAAAGLGTLPAVLNKPVIASFSSNRGLAVGIALAGCGVGAFAGPRFAAALIERGGWKLGYMGLGCVAIAIAPIIWGALGRGRPAVSGTRARGTPQIEVPGASLVEAVRSRVFWILSAISMLAGLGMSGPVAHWVPFLRDRAMTATDAAACMSLLGLSSIAGRLIAGATLDRVSGPLVGLPLLGFGAVGIILAVSSGVAVAAPAILLLGFAVGSEFDVLAYFVSRYFGLRSHATVFGWTYGMVALGAAIGPVVVGALRDRQGDYAMGFILSGACLAVAALLCPLLGRYRYVP